MRCSCSQKDVYFLLNILTKTHEDCGNFRTGCVVLRIELAVRAVYDTCAACPLHCRNSVLGNGRGVGVRPDTGFSDIAKSDYFYNAVKWAVGSKVTSGLTETTFGPQETCTRAQTVTFLWRAAGSPQTNSVDNPFTDVKRSDYYYQAVLWAVANNVTNGVSATSFDPNVTVQRDQVVTFLWRASGKPAAKADLAFSDLADGAFYADAVQWAVAHGITTGTSSTTFAPADGCTRAQIVTFLYRSKN